MGEVVQGPWKAATHANIGKLQLARELDRSRKTIERYMLAGMPHSRNREGHARFNLKACLAWLDEQRASEDERTG